MKPKRCEVVAKSSEAGLGPPLRFLFLFGLGLALGMSCGCTREDQRVDSELKQFEPVKVGMTRVEVEKRLGPPRVGIGKEVYYGMPAAPPDFDKSRSPILIGKFIVTYSSNNMVETKKLAGPDKW